jgi:hypothetical protein
MDNTFIMVITGKEPIGRSLIVSTTGKTFGKGETLLQMLAIALALTFFFSSKLHS